MVSKKKISFIVCACLGVVFLVLGCVFISVFDNMIHSQVKSNLPLKPGTESYKNWQHPKTPIYFQIWFFDIVNHDEILNGEKPAVAQRGPYTYREFREKFNITYHENGTVEYRERRSFVFDRHKSVGEETDKFYTANLPMLTIIDILRNEFAFIKEPVYAFLDSVEHGLFIELSAHDLLWGYEEPLIKLVKDFAKREFNVTLPISDLFGLFVGQNGTDDGLYLIDSGLNGVDNFGKVLRWNGEDTLNFWTSDLANMINGSDGTLYPPFVNTDDTKYLFSSDLCRSLGIVYKKRVNLRGIPLDRFVAPDVMFGNVSVNPYNAGFCTPATSCLPTGLLNVSSCRTGAPIVMSMPHFLGCDESVQKAVKNIHPVREDYQSVIEIEPLTGVTMGAAKRLQLNVYLDKVNGSRDTENLKPTFLPLLWLNESAFLDPDNARKFKSEVLDKITITDAIKYSLIALGGFLIVLVLALFVRHKVYRSKPGAETSRVVNRNDDDEPLLRPNGHAPVS